MFFEKNIVHFSAGNGGGVQTIIDNIIKYSTARNIKYRIIYTLRIEDKSAWYLDLKKLKAHESVFTYSKFENTYYVFKRLANCLINEEEIIVAHDWLELGMASRLGIKNPLLFFLHADTNYYYDLAILHKNVIDIYVCYSRVIERNLKKSINLLHDKIYYQIYPVPQIRNLRFVSKELRIIFCVKNLLEERKNFKLIPDIAKYTASLNIQWTIVGLGYSKIDLIGLLGTDKVIYYPKLDNDELIELMQKQDIFILPSYSEGLPVSLIEAMKCQNVPLITSWNGAELDLIINNQTGFVLPNSPSCFANIILDLYSNRNKLETIGINAMEKANSFCDPFNSVRKLETILLATQKKIKLPPTQKVYSSRLDGRWIPNYFTKVMRKYFVKK
jgi:glycosyltransferase involved in cell wall biosynthesis